MVRNAVRDHNRAAQSIPDEGMVRIRLWWRQPRELLAAPIRQAVPGAERHAKTIPGVRKGMSLVENEGTTEPLEMVVSETELLNLRKLVMPDGWEGTYQAALQRYNSFCDAYYSRFDDKAAARGRNPVPFSVEAAFREISGQDPAPFEKLEVVEEGIAPPEPNEPDDAVLERTGKVVAQSIVEYLENRPDLQQREQQQKRKAESARSANSGDVKERPLKDKS